MSTRFWFGERLPTEFADPVVQRQLSFNGQLHFQCSACNEVTWVGISFGRRMLERADANCPSCGRKTLRPLKFVESAWRACRRCGTTCVINAEIDFRCKACSGTTYETIETNVHPPYPDRLFALHGKEAPFGVSVKADVEFLMKYVRSLRLLPQFHRTCIHLTAFIDSLFANVYGSDPGASEFLNASSGLMRTVYRETGDLDAAYLSIAAMIRGRELATEPIHRAVYGLNIGQNVYSVLARGHAELVSPRFGFDLKTYGIALARQTLNDFELLGEDWLAELRARQKWLLGDILKAGTPSEDQIDEALRWFHEALDDPALPASAQDAVREGIQTALTKRRALAPADRSRAECELARLAERQLDQTQGIERIHSLDDLLRTVLREPDREQHRRWALRCLGEAIIYTVENDPGNMLRFAGTWLSRLAAGFAAERIEAGAPLDAMAGVEAFRALAIDTVNVRPDLGHHVPALEAELRLRKLFSRGASPDPVALGEALLAAHRAELERDLRELLGPDETARVIWCEVWDGRLLSLTISSTGGALSTRVTVGDLQLDDAERAMTLPMVDTPPGRLREQQVLVALTQGRKALSALFHDDDSSKSSVFVGPSLLAAWPVDAAEAVSAEQVVPIRPLTFAPSIRIAATTRRRSHNRALVNVLAISYGGEDLPGVRREINAIQRVYGSGVTVLDGGRVSRADILAALTRPYQVVHFSGHGGFDYLEPMQSKLYFSIATGGAGTLTATDLLHCKTIGESPVVVLSACTSAAVLPNGANNFLGLAGALLRAGAAAIVGTRWPVADASAAAFSEQFHTLLAGGHSVPDAVALAKDHLRTAPVDEWSAFMCIGG